MSITGQQIRAARAVLNWSVRDLAEATGIGSATIVRYEAVSTEVPKSRKNHIETIRSCFEAAGIEFVGQPDDGPGIRIYKTVSTPED